LAAAIIAAVQDFGDWAGAISGDRRPALPGNIGNISNNIGDAGVSAFHINSLAPDRYFVIDVTGI